MRNPSSVFGVGRYVLAIGLVAGSVALMNAQRKAEFTARDVGSVALAPKKTEFTVHDRTYYADPATANLMRPGLVITIKSAAVAADGTISVDYTIADPKGQPLDILGVDTYGPVSLSYIAAYIPAGQTQFWSYVNKPQTSPITKVTGNQAGTDSGGTRTTVATGEYLYTFKQKAVSQTGGAYDKTVTHRIGIYGSRNLTEFDLSTYYDDVVFDFVPNGTKVASTRDVVRSGACNKCHDSLSAHGGSRRSLELCIMCHQPQSVDPDTGQSIAADVMFHRLHAGSQLPSVIAGGTYQIIGHNQAVSDWSTVVFPANGGVLACTECHDPAMGAAQQNNYMTNPNREACGSCHDTTNFATGANHNSPNNLVETSDKLCAGCHIPKGDNEFDASVVGAHTIATQSASAPGINLAITNVSNGFAGKAPLVTFTMKDNSGAPISLAQMAGGRLALVMAGPTTDYGLPTAFTPAAPTTPGYVSESAITAAICNASGSCTYQFTHTIPATAKGTFAIGMEARRTLIILPGTTQQISTQYGAKNVVSYFSVDGSPVAPRRTVVSIDNCNKCHVKLSLHGENRNQIEQCVLCHNPSENDLSTRSTATTPADKAAPAQGVNFAYMIHRIHTGENLAAMGASYTIVGFGGSHNDFSEVRYPAMGPSGAVGYTQSCYMCHVNGSEANLPIGLNAVTNPSALVSPVGSTTSACTGCHATGAAMGHALDQTDPKFGESCAVCHAGTADFNVTKIHAAN